MLSLSVGMDVALFRRLARRGKKSGFGSRDLQLTAELRSWKEKRTHLAGLRLDGGVTTATTIASPLCATEGQHADDTQLATTDISEHVIQS